MIEYSDDLAAMQPILLVGAGRSGTNLLAMALGSSEELKNVYEQRYVWTKGMNWVSTDLRHPDSATGAISRYIRAHFARQAEDQPPNVRLVDKTTANALRLGFCTRVFPRAKVINVIRNPFDNIASRIVELHKSGREVDSRSMTGADRRAAVLRRRLTHARDLIARGNLPLDRLPAAMADQIPEKIRILLKGGVVRYAERVPGFRQVADAQGLVAALCYQWRELVTTATRDGRKLSNDRYIELFYEDIVRAPAAAARQLTEFIELKRPEPVVEYLIANAKPETVGNWRHRITPEQQAEIRERLTCEMQFFGIEED